MEIQDADSARSAECLDDWKWGWVEASSGSPNDSRLGKERGKSKDVTEDISERLHHNAYHRMQINKRNLNNIEGFVWDQEYKSSSVLEEKDYIHKDRGERNNCFFHIVTQGSKKQIGRY